MGTWDLSGGQLQIMFFVFNLETLIWFWDTIEQHIWKHHRKHNTNLKSHVHLGCCISRNLNAIFPFTNRVNWAFIVILPLLCYCGIFHRQSWYMIKNKTLKSHQNVKYPPLRSPWPLSMVLKLGLYWAFPDSHIDTLFASAGNLTVYTLLFQVWVTDLPSVAIDFLVLNWPEQRKIYKVYCVFLCASS